MSQSALAPVVFARHCEVTVIPAGHSLTIAQGTEAVVTQALGGRITLQIPALGILVQLAAKDSDAIGIEAAAPAAARHADGGAPVTRAALAPLVEGALKTCFDPEIPVNIVDLGLVYGIDLTEAPGGGWQVTVAMTLTAPGCGMGGVIAADAREKILELPGVREAAVNVVWEPLWGPERISSAGRAILGIDA
ncbi:MAG: iron-sulfur cluster assembly protein [bacterium]